MRIALTGLRGAEPPLGCTFIHRALPGLWKKSYAHLGQTPAREGLAKRYMAQLANASLNEG